MALIHKANRTPYTDLNLWKRQAKIVAENQASQTWTKIHRDVRVLTHVYHKSRCRGRVQTTDLPLRTLVIPGLDALIAVIDTTWSVMYIPKDPQLDQKNTPDIGLASAYLCYFPWPTQKLRSSLNCTSQPNHLKNEDHYGAVQKPKYVSAMTARHCHTRFDSTHATNLLLLVFVPSRSLGQLPATMSNLTLHSVCKLMIMPGAQIWRIGAVLWVHVPHSSAKYYGYDGLRANHQNRYGSRDTVIAEPYLGPWTAPYMNTLGRRIRLSHIVEALFSPDRINTGLVSTMGGKDKMPDIRYENAEYRSLSRMVNLSAPSHPFTAALVKRSTYYGKCSVTRRRPMLFARIDGNFSMVGVVVDFESKRFQPT
ncbi:hypothetical protein CLF_112964 [Clonorchis sinensis]|uniref:Uncharacterized protein n=1 Tax=Clonorchis sinensis TaxID=79923 RepID=G7YXC7_CLOSI|nr:hypothetical protein CLF_112964 [Clonorchis sinensis]